LKKGGFPPPKKSPPFLKPPFLERALFQKRVCAPFFKPLCKKESFLFPPKNLNGPPPKEKPLGALLKGGTAAEFPQAQP